MVADSLCKMDRSNVGALLVMEGGKIVGLLSERDYARKVLLADRTSRTTRVEEIMDTKVLFVMPDDPIEWVLALMSERRIRHIPVMDEGRLIWLMSLGDVIQVVLSDHEFLIDQLVRYINGSQYGLHDPSLRNRATIEERVVTS